MSQDLIVLENLTREFPSGEGKVVAVKSINVTIKAGEMVAITGSSGSGKSTLMNILGCLDRPTSGSYKINGQKTSSLGPDELAALRREYFGFVFQRYHLLSSLSALANVEIPAIYAGVATSKRHSRAQGLLKRLGMGDRSSHHPNQLSGGQQQRVSIARALMNGGNVILADEPTGALDRASGQEVLKILEELNAEGKTIIIVTHEASVAARAKRIIEFSDGAIISDRLSAGYQGAVAEDHSRAIDPSKTRSWRIIRDHLKESFKMAFLAMTSHKLRTFLTMLGIIIGISSVVSITALGDLAKNKVLSDISSLGTNTIEVFPGKTLGDRRASKVKTLIVSDAVAMAQQSYVDGVTPTISSNATLRHGGQEGSALINGVGPQYFAVKGSKIASGHFFDEADTRNVAQDIVIDDKTDETFFKSEAGGAVGKVIFVGSVPCRVVGVMKKQEGGFGSTQNFSVYLPYTTVQARILGDTSLRSILVKVNDHTESAAAEHDITRFLTQRHHVKDFTILNSDDIRKTISNVTGTLTLLIASIGGISLIVGGIGVMNIMLVSVSERIGEIGVRMAVGARQNDIMQQFLIEAVMVCFIGGVFGIAFAFSLATTFNILVPNYTLSLSPISIMVAVLCSTGIGVVFGYLPARQASFLDPLAALSRD